MKLPEPPAPSLTAPIGHKEELRRQRLQHIYTILEKKKSMRIDELRAYLVWEFGLSHRTAGEYIHTLIACHKANMHEGIIRLSE